MPTLPSSVSLLLFPFPHDLSHSLSVCPGDGPTAHLYGAMHGAENRIYCKPRFLDHEELADVGTPSPLCLSRCLSLSLSLSVSLCLSLSLSLPLCLSVCLSPCLSLSVCLSLCLSVCLSLSLSLYLSVCLSLSVSLSLPLSLSLCPLSLSLLTSLADLRLF
jgi:hypothetical protein